MPAPPPRPRPSALIDGLRALGRRPRWTLALILLGTLLGQLGPALEIAAKAGSNPLTEMILGSAATMPLGLYFLPKWISRLDADAKNHPANAASSWPKPFDGRWLRAFGTNLAIELPISMSLGMVIVGGASLLGLLGLFLVIPGTVFLILTGFAPLRVLLRGDSIMDALRWSVRGMARHWPQIIPAALVILLIVFSGVLALALIQNAAFARFGEAGPDAWTRLKHPLIWASQILGTLSLLWVSASFLALYHRLEELAEGQPK